MPAPLPAFDWPPYRLSGVVCTCLLNHALQLAALGDQAHQAPYKAPPTAPVLGVKPRNTLAGDGDPLVLPPDSAALEIGASLGIVIGRTACRLTPENALDHVAGYVIVNEVSLPRESHYRPSVRLMARDGYCPVGAQVVPAASVPQPDALAVRVWIDGELVREGTTGERVRPVAQLLADVTDFMTLQPGDILTLGVAADAPQARAGQAVRLEIEGVGTLAHVVIAEGSPA